MGCACAYDAGVSDVACVDLSVLSVVPSGRVHGLAHSRLDRQNDWRAGRRSPACHPAVIVWRDPVWEGIKGVVECEDARCLVLVLPPQLLLPASQQLSCFVPWLARPPGNCSHDVARCVQQMIPMRSPCCLACPLHQHSHPPRSGAHGDASQ